MESLVKIVKERIQVRGRKAGRIGAERFHLGAVLGKLRRIWVYFAYHQISEMFQKVPKNGGRLPSALQDIVEKGEGGGTVAVEDMVGQVQNHILSRKAQEVVHRRGVKHFGFGSGRALVQQGQGVAKPAVRPDRNEVRRVFRQGKIAFLGNIKKMVLDVLHGNPMEFIPLAAGQNGQGNLFRLRGGQNKEHMGRRFLQRFQKGVEGLLGEHVHFVDDVHLLPAHRRQSTHRLPQSPDFLNAPVGGRIDFINIEAGACIDFPAALALIAWIHAVRMKAVHRLGQDFCHTGLSCAPGAGKKIGMGQPVLLDGPLKGDGNMLLPHHLRKRAGPPFSI